MGFNTRNSRMRRVRDQYFEEILTALFNIVYVNSMYVTE